MLAIVATAVAATAAQQVVARRRRRSQDRESHVITVYRPLDQIRVNGKLPSPLTELGDRVDVELRPAPGDRGTEILIRPRTGGVSAGTLRRALRDSRSLLETGDVLLPSGPSTTVPTWRNRALRAATQRGREGGLL